MLIGLETIVLLRSWWERIPGPVGGNKVYAASVENCVIFFKPLEMENPYYPVTLPLHSYLKNVKHGFKRIFAHRVHSNVLTTARCDTGTTQRHSVGRGIKKLWSMGWREHRGYFRHTPGISPTPLLLFLSPHDSLSIVRYFWESQSQFGTSWMNNALETHIHFYPKEAVV